LPPQLHSTAASRARRFDGDGDAEEARCVARLPCCRLLSHQFLTDVVRLEGEDDSVDEPPRNNVVVASLSRVSETFSLASFTSCCLPSLSPASPTASNELNDKSTTLVLLQSTDSSPDKIVCGKLDRATDERRGGGGAAAEIEWSPVP